MHKKVSEDVATNDVNRWLDFKKVSDKRRETYKEQTGILIDEICEGNLIINEDCTITHKLKFPVGTDLSVNDITYKPRVNSEMLKSYMQGVKSTDADGRLIAYVAGLTGVAKGIIAKLDTEDSNISQAIVIFFI